MPDVKSGGIVSGGACDGHEGFEAEIVRGIRTRKTVRRRMDDDMMAVADGEDRKGATEQ